MKIHRLLLTALLPLALMKPASAADVGLTIKLAHDSERERQTQAQLERLLQSYDVSRWVHTRDIVIDEEEIPHSHPVLTLHARHLKDDDLLLSTFVHEQTHRMLDEHPAEHAAAVRELKKLYPRIPTGYPEGSDSAEVNYDHLIIIYTEYRADQRLMGELRARAVMEFFAHDHYRWLYREVLRDPEKVGRIVKAHHL
ncbi:hypothetical protein ACS5PN_24195 [Roseateles sp. NT4]|uniref:hypothetical protein n=1 Tax=Roseateles sp. NT4 TaxID=3453715 RepID=UPI003EEE7142